MSKWYLMFGVLFALSPNCLFADTCEPGVELMGEFTITKPYEGLVDDYDDVGAKDRDTVVLPKGKYFISSILTLTKKRKTKCEYAATNLEIKALKGSYKWKSDKTYKSRVELSASGEWQRFYLNRFYPSLKKKITGESGEEISRTYDGNRPLYLGTSYSKMDDTNAIFTGSVAYFDFGDGHEFFGKTRISLSVD